MTYPRRMITKTAFTPTGPSTYGSAPGIWRMDEVAYWQKQGLWPNPSIVPDQYFPYVSLLLSSTSLSNANNNLFVDSSGAFNPVSRNGNTTQGSFTPYGSNWSNYFDGSGDYLTVADNTALQMSGDFTWEAWVYPISLPGGGSYKTFWSQRASSGGFGGPLVVMDSAGNLLLFIANAAASTWSVSGFDTNLDVSLNSWQHIALVKSGSTLTLYKNGTAGTSTTHSTAVGTSGSTALMAGAADGSQAVDGYMSNFRIVKGTAVYTANFTPPTAPLTAISGTSLLTCQSNRFIDNSSNAFAITVNGDTKVQKFSPFSSSTYTGISYNQSDITNWSGYFNGGTDRLQVPVTSNMYLGTTYTIEAWVYYNSTSYGARPIFNEMEPFQGGFAGLSLTMNTSGQFVVEYRPATSGAVTTITGPTVTPYTWYHIAFSNNATSGKLFVNGVQVGSTTTIGDYPSAKTNTVAVGSWGSGWNDGGIPAAAWIGYISNLRVVKGTAVYTANFTPPTSPLTAISGTVLLTCQNAAFTDNSSVNNILTPVTTATVTGNSPFNTTGYWSNYFDGSGDYERIASSQTALQFGTGDFTIEAWVYSTGGTGTYQHILTGGSSWTSGSGGVYWYYNGGSPYIGAAWNQIATNPAVNSSTLAINTWHHFAVVRSGNILYLYVNGTSVDTLDVTGVSIAVNNQSQTNIGGGGWDQDFGGYLSNLRVVKGTAVYTSNFTVPTTPLSAITNTSLLTCQNGSFKDNSSNAFTLVPAGNVAVQPYNPFYTSTVASNGGSMYFDGSGDYVSSAASQSTTFGSGDFTIQLWVYSGANSTSTRLAGNGAGAGWGANKWVLGTGFAGTPNKFFFSVNNTGVAVASTTTFNDSAWHHVAITRSGNTWRLFVDGVQENTLTSSVSFDGGIAANISVGSGQISGDADWAGWICGFQMVKGTALYTANFTRPTAPANPTAATTLLLNGMNAGVYDATTINDMETVGNAQVSTVQSKFGGSSMYFDGSGDYLVVPSTPTIAFGTGAFTVEGWVYVSAYSYNGLFSSWNAAATGVGVLLGLDNTGKPQFSIGNANAGANESITGASAIPLNTWTHLAATKTAGSGGTMRLFVDGVSVGTTTTTRSVERTVAVVGRYYQDTNNYYLNGYIDDLRVTAGVARYTANFTPPTQAFPVY